MTNTLDDFEVKIGLPSNVLPGQMEEFKKYFSMDISVLEKLNAESCAEIGYRLLQYSLYIQRCLNREKAAAKTLKSQINNIIAPRISQYSGSWELQRVNAILDNDAAKQMNENLIKVEEKIDNLEFIANGITKLAEQLKQLQYSKKDV